MYIFGINIAKRFHEAAIIDSSDKVIVKRIRFANSHTGFLKLMDTIRKLDAPAEFGMEATGYYWLPLYAHLRQEEQTVHVITPRLVLYVYPSDQELRPRRANRR